MKSIRRLAPTYFALSCMALLPQVACTSSSGDPMLIIHNVSPDSSCAIPANKSQAFVSRGVIDTRGSRVYTFTPLVESRTEVLNADDPLQRAIFIEGAEVSLSAGEGVNLGGVTTEFTQRFSGTLEPGALTTFAFELIPASVTDALASQITAPDTIQVLADVKIFGTLGGGSVETPTFTYPITFCESCRLDTPSCIDYTPPAELSCFPGQDNFLVECCVSGQGDIQCPPVPEDPPMAVDAGLPDAT